MAWRLTNKPSARHLLGMAMCMGMPLELLRAHDTSLAHEHAVNCFAAPVGKKEVQEEEVQEEEEKGKEYGAWHFRDTFTLHERASNLCTGNGLA